MDPATVESTELGAHADRPRRLALWAASALTLSLATAVVLVAVSGPGSTLAVVREVRGSWLGGAVVVQLAGLLCLGQVYRSAHRALGGELSHREGMTTALSAFAMAQLLPGGGAAGGVLAARRLTQVGATPVAAITTVLHVGFVSVLALSLVVSGATISAAIATGQHVPHAAVTLGVTSTLLGGFAALRRLSVTPGARRWLHGTLDRLRWRGRGLPERWLAEMRAKVRPLAPLRRLAAPVAWSAGKWSADVVVLSLALVAAGGTFSLVVVAVTYGIANLLNTLPVSPGGVGLVEGGMAGSLMAFGVDPATATVTTVTYRLLAYWLPLVLAAPPALVVLRQVRRPHVGAAAATGPGDGS
jgi:uncharacterized protein (TIRG00374 family)